MTKILKDIESKSDSFQLEDEQITIKKSKVPWKGEDATLILIIDNSEVIKGHKAMMQIAIN